MFFAHSLIKLLRYLPLVFCFTSDWAFGEISSPLFKPVAALQARDLAIIVNDNDPLSKQIGDYYRQQRQVPLDQVIHVRFAANHNILNKAEFKKIKQQVDNQTPKHIQAYALTWIKPFRVECMSITSAFAADFDPAFCAEGCQATRNNPYYASEATQPFDQHIWRPTMVVATQDFAETKKLIDRGIAADFSQPRGSAYLLKTSDRARSSRAEAFASISEKFRPYWPVKYLEQDYIAGRDDVMFYFTGLTVVPHLGDNHYLPGAVADHLTSAGGVLTGSSQMSILEWLKAGVTGSYGAVVEPCNFPAKFPNPEILMFYYLKGSSLIEAYWKSVAQPGQGIFVGEPLAKPFAYAAGH